MDVEAETTTFTTKQLTQKALDANFVIQRALSERAFQLEAQLKRLDDLVESVHKGVPAEEIPEDELGNEIQIPGTKKVSSLLTPSELLSPSSPFFEEASQRAHYVRWTTVHPIKGKEAEVLADAVRKENQRLEAYRSRNSPSAPVIDITNNIDGINWSIVAEKVSDASYVKRTPDECRIQWVGNLHPKVNHGEWTREELDKLDALTSAALDAGEQLNWVRVAEELGTNRVPIECMKRATMASRPWHVWDPEADQRLLAAIEKFGTNNWRLVARAVSDYVTTWQCQNRYLRSLDPSIRHAHWTPDEEARLRKAVAVYGHSWVDVASVMPGRTNEQCREKWNETGKGEERHAEWTEEEDAALVNAVEVLGNRWKEIAKRVGGKKTGLNCRLRYSRLKNKMKTQAEEEEETEACAADVNGSASESVIPTEALTPILASTSRQKSTANKPRARSLKQARNQVENNEEAGAENEAQIIGEHPLSKNPRRIKKKAKGKGKEKEKDVNPGLTTLEGTGMDGTQEENLNGRAIPEEISQGAEITKSVTKERGKGKGKRKYHTDEEGSVAVDGVLEKHTKKRKQGNRDDDVIRGDRKKRGKGRRGRGRATVVVGGRVPAQQSTKGEANAFCEGHNEHGEVQEIDVDPAQRVELSTSVGTQGGQVNKQVIGSKRDSAKGRGRGGRVINEGTRRSKRIANKIENT